MDFPIKSPTALPKDEEPSSILLNSLCSSKSREKGVSFSGKLSPKSDSDEEKSLKSSFSYSRSEKEKDGDGNDDDGDNHDDHRHQKPHNNLLITFIQTSFSRLESGLTSLSASTYKAGRKMKMNRKAVMMKASGYLTSRQLLDYCFWTILALTIQFLVGGGTGHWAFPDGLVGKNGTSACAGDDRNSSICDLYDEMERGTNQFILLSAFILGGFLVSSVQQWLKRRNMYTGVCGATRNLLVNICSLIQDDHERFLLTRWALLGYELAVLKGRGLIDTTEGKTYLENLSLLRSDEWEKMVDGDRHTTVWFWIQFKAADMARQDEITQFEFQTICNAITLSRHKANDLMSCIDQDQPPPYIFVCGLLININLLIHAVATGIKWAICMYEETASGLSQPGSLFIVWTKPRMYIEVILLYLYTFIYAMMFDVCSLLYNPFGPRAIDIKHCDVGGGIRNLAEGLSKNIVQPETMFNFSYQSAKRASSQLTNDDQTMFDDLYFLGSDKRESFDLEVSKKVCGQNQRRSLLIRTMTQKAL